MAKFARLQQVDNKQVVLEIVEGETIEEISTRFHPEFVATLVSVPADAAVGSTKSGSTWTHPVAAAPVAPPEAAKRFAVSRTEYYGLFTPLEEAMIRIAAKEDVTTAKLAAGTAAEKARLMGIAALQVMLDRTDKLAPADVIDLGSEQVQQGLGLLVQMGLISAERKAAIEQGV